MARYVNKGRYYWAKGDVKGKLLHFVEKQDNGCWKWTGNVSHYGYGRICYDSKAYFAHRVSYELFKGKIDDGLYVCHACDNPQCVNPDHLFLGDQKANMADCKAKGRYHHGERTGGAKLTDAVVTKIIEHGKNKTYSHSKLGEMFGVSRSEIGSILAGQRWLHLPGSRERLLSAKASREALGHRLKVTKAEIKAMTKLKVAGYGPTEIGSFFNVTRSCVHRILKRCTV